jgi:hypothetical protein
LSISQNSTVASESQNEEMQMIISQQSTISAVESASSSASSVMAFRHIQGTKATQSKCFICDSVGNRRAIPWSAILSLLKSYDFGLWLHEISDVKKKPPYSFDNDGVPSKDYRLWTGLKKEDFDVLVHYLTPEMRNSSARSIRNALAMMLILLRTNLKQEAIGHMFGTTQQIVSSTIDTVSSILERTFVTQNLGYSHITRDEALASHSNGLNSRVLNQSSEKLCLVVDCTYCYIEQPTNSLEQRKTYNSYKKRNLYKPMLLTFPDGYILEAAGPYYSDHKHNDAEIIKHHFEHSDLLLFMEEDDFFLWDRGYRDAVDSATAHNIKSFMPALLQKKNKNHVGEKAFTCQDANDSRKVTMSRWVVESANGRLKNVFIFFKHTIEGGYGPMKIMRLVRIACAIFNKFFPIINPNKEFQDLVADRVEQHANDVNLLKLELESKKLIRMNEKKWTKSTAAAIPDFPSLTWDELKIFTLGSYQLKVAERYIQEHMSSNQEFGIMLHNVTPNIIRSEIQSRFSGSDSHTVWIKYIAGQDGIEGLDGHYCKCKTGERTLGCCSHVASVSMIILLFPSLVKMGMFRW